MAIAVARWAMQPSRESVALGLYPAALLNVVTKALMKVAHSRSLVSLECARYRNYREYTPLFSCACPLQKTSELPIGDREGITN